MYFFALETVLFYHGAKGGFFVVVSVQRKTRSVVFKVAILFYSVRTQVYHKISHFFLVSEFLHRFNYISFSVPVLVSQSFWDELNEETMNCSAHRVVLRGERCCKRWRYRKTQNTVVSPRNVGVLTNMHVVRRERLNELCCILYKT